MIVVVKTSSTRSSENPGHPEWLVDARFATDADRVQNRAVLHDLVAEEIQPRPRRRVGPNFSRRRASHLPQSTLSRILPRSRSFVIACWARSIGRRRGDARAVAYPYRRESLPVRSSPPNEGEHTDEILRSLGLSAEDIDGLRRAQAVA